MATELSAEGITVRYGALVAVEAVTVRFRSGEVNAIIGPNGAGKSSLFAACVNWTPHLGTVSLDGEDMTSVAPERLARRGVVRSFQVNVAFPSMTVFDNVTAVAQLRERWVWRRNGRWASGLNRRGGMSERVTRLLDQVRIPRSAMERYPAELSFGLQRHLSVALALALEPVVLLLDEPGAGLSESELDEVGGLIADLAGGGVAVGLIEHRMSLVMAHAHEVLVLDDGREIFRGSPAEVQASSAVQQAYLGVA